jgi:RNA polymerase sigma factor (sigma-70 family)
MDTGNDKSEQQGLAIEEAFLLMLKRNESMLYGITNRFCRNEEDRKELMQQIVYRAWLSFPNFRHESSEATWLYSTAFRITAKHSRDERRRAELSEQHSQTYVFAEENRLNDLTKIEQLRDSDKEIVMLLMQGYKYGEVSDILGIARVTLRNRIQRMKQRLGLKPSKNEGPS